MKPTSDDLASLEAAKLRQAGSMDDVSRALAGAVLFDALRDRLSWGVLIDRPDADEDEVRAEVRLRLEKMRRRDAAA